MEGKQARTRSSSSMWYCRSSASIAVLFGDRGLPLAILTLSNQFEIESKNSLAKQNNRSRPGSNRRPRD